MPGLRYLGLGTQADDERSWNTKLSRYLGLGTIGLGTQADDERS